MVKITTNEPENWKLWLILLCRKRAQKNCSAPKKEVPGASWNDFWGKKWVVKPRTPPQRDQTCTPRARARGQTLPSTKLCCPDVLPQNNSKKHPKIWNCRNLVPVWREFQGKKWRRPPYYWSLGITQIRWDLLAKIFFMKISNIFRDSFKLCAASLRWKTMWMKLRLRIKINVKKLAHQNRNVVCWCWME